MKLVRDSLYLFCSRALNILFQLLLVIVISRKLGPEGFGLYSFLTSIILVGNLIASFGLDTFMVREIAKDNNSAKRCLGEVLCLKFIISLITIFAFSILALVLPMERNTQVLLLTYSLSLLFHSLNESFWFVGDGLGRFKIHSFLWPVTNFFKAAMGISAILFWGEVGMLITGLVLAEALALLVSWIVVAKAIGPLSLNLNFYSWKGILRNSTPIALGGFLSVFYFRLDSIMLELMKGHAAVGYYNAAYRVFEVFSIFPSTIMLVIFPWIVKSRGLKNGSLNGKLLQGFLALAVSGFVSACAISLFSSQTIHLLYGESYQPSVEVLKILSWATLFYFINFYAGYTLISLGRERLNIFYLLLITGINFALNIIMIPEYGHIGAATGTLVSEIILFFLYLFSRKKWLNE